MSTYSRQLSGLLTQDGETGPERRPSVNVSLHGAAAKCCSWVHLGCLSRLGLPLACGELWCKGILQLTSRVRVRPVCIGSVRERVLTGAMVTANTHNLQEVFSKGEPRGVVNGLIPRPLLRDHTQEDRVHRVFQGAVPDFD